MAFVPLLLTLVVDMFGGGVKRSAKIEIETNSDVCAESAFGEKKNLP